MDPSPSQSPAPGRWVQGPPGSNSIELFSAHAPPQHLLVHDQKHHWDPNSVPIKGRAQSPPITLGWGSRRDKSKTPRPNKMQQTRLLAREARAGLGQRSLRKSQLVPPFLYFYASPKQNKYKAAEPCLGCPRPSHSAGFGTGSCLHDLSPCDPAQVGCKGSILPQGLHLHLNSTENHWESTHH